MFGNYRVLYAKAVYDDEEVEAVVRSLRAGVLCEGAETDRFEREVASLFGKAHGVFVNSASSGLEMTLKALDLPPGSEIITPACTFGTSFSSILMAGHRPRLVDVELGSYVTTPSLVESAVTARTRAILIPNLAGSLPDLRGLRNLCDRSRLVFIEDSADQIGGTFQGLPTGHYSDVVVTSFYASHHITAGGNGGMVCADDSDLVHKLKMYRDWGRKPVSDRSPERFVPVGDAEYDGKFLHHVPTGNHRCGEMCAAFGRVQLKKLPAFICSRVAAFERLFKFFSRYEDRFHLPRKVEGAEFTWLAFPLTVKPPLNRNKLVQSLEENGIQTRPMFSGNISRHPVGDDLDPTSYPVANHIFENSLLVGCHPGLTGEELTYLCDTFKELLDG